MIIRSVDVVPALPLAQVMRGTQPEKAAGNAGFGEELEESLAAPGTASAPPARATQHDGRRWFGTPVVGTNAVEPPPQPTSPGSDRLAPDQLGLKAAAGSVATINGESFYGSEAGWSVTPPAAAPEERDPTGQELLGFEPEWVDKVPSLWLNEDGLPAGIVYLNTKHFATTETAHKLAALFGATAVPIEYSRGGSNGDVPQWQLDFGNGKVLNAGLVADMFLRDPMRAFARVQAETA